MRIPDRIKALRRVPANQLLPHPRNWREHPPAQLDALRGILDEIGWADCILARETHGGLQLIDGHARTSIAPDSEVPVLVLDLNDAEADKLLAMTAVPIQAQASGRGNHSTLRSARIV